MEPGDQALLWEMLYLAIFVPQGKPPASRDVLDAPSLRWYAEGWGREGDAGFVAVDAEARREVGAAWLRLPVGDWRGYGCVDDCTPELSIAVVPECRSRGAGSMLLEHAIAEAARRSSAISLSVSAENPAVRLYARFGFEVVAREGGALTMRKSLVNPER